MVFGILSFDLNLGWQNILMGKIGVSKIVFGIFLIQVLVKSVAVAHDKHMNIWPMPKSVSYGSNILYLSNELVLKTEGSKYIDASGILKEGFSRIVDVIKGGHVIEANFSRFSPSQVIKGIHVVVLSPNDEVLMKTFTFPFSLKNNSTWMQLIILFSWDDFSIIICGCLPFTG